MMRNLKKWLVPVCQTILTKTWENWLKNLYKQIRSRVFASKYTETPQMSFESWVLFCT